MPHGTGNMGLIELQLHHFENALEEAGEIVQLPANDRVIVGGAELQLGERTIAVDSLQNRLLDLRLEHVDWTPNLSTAADAFANGELAATGTTVVVVVVVESQEHGCLLAGVIPASGCLDLRPATVKDPNNQGVRRPPLS